MLKLNFQHFGRLVPRASSLEEILMVTKIEDRRKREMRWLDGIADSMDMSLNKLQKMVKDREAWGVTIHRVATSQTGLGD